MSNSLVNPAHYGAANHGNMHSLPYHETVSMGSPPPPHTAQEETPHEPVNFEFCCRNADGGRMARVSGFQSMIELYAKLAQVLEIQSPSEIMFCTLNTDKVDTDHILSGQIGLEDIIYVHRKGNRKQVEVKKTVPFLGLTIADNSNGSSYIKKIKEDSTASRVPFIKVGDHIESIMDQSMVGCRHFEVAKYLRQISVNENFTMTLREPILPNQAVSPGKTKKPALVDLPQNGKFSVRLRGNVMAMMERDMAANAQMNAAVRRINKQLEQFIGIHDDELAEELWRMALQKNPHQFALCVENSELNDFKFNHDFIFEVWAIVDDGLNGRLPSI